MRPHHLLCVLTYVGKGYSPAFVANFDVVVARLAAGEPLVVHEGPDDICRPLLATAELHCHHSSVVARDANALRDLGELLGGRLQPGDVVPLDDALLERMRSAFARGNTRAACDGCEWFDLCSKVADAGYATTALRRPVGRPSELDSRPHMLIAPETEPHVPEDSDCQSR